MSTTRAAAVMLAVITLVGCKPTQAPNEIRVQRFFGTCNAQYGQQTDVSQAQSECGIMTVLLNKFAAENPDIKVRVATVAWPGYNQLSAQLATGDAPDVVTMHESAIPDFESRHLLEPMSEGLRAVGVDPQSFTEASLKGVTRHGEIYGLPIDTWAPLWHINMSYFRQAGLVKNDRPILPTSPEELLAQARQFKQATGRPYLVQALANQKPAYSRSLYTLLMQQDSDFFANPQRIRLQTPEAHKVLQLFKTLYEEDLTTKNQDYAAATNGFMNGDGGVYLVGTWLIGDFDAESKKAGRPLYNGYTVYPYPRIFHTRDAAFADGHAWVMPVRERTSQQRDAVYRLMKFFADNDFEWSRTGHLPAFKSVIDSESFRALPHRQNIAELTRTGSPLPAGVERRFAIEDTIGEEMAPAIAGQKSIDDALADGETRVNDLLFHVLKSERPQKSTKEHK